MHFKFILKILINIYMYRLGVQLSDLTNYCIDKNPFVILKLFDFLIYFVISPTGGGLVLVLSVLVSLVSVPPTDRLRYRR